jgi:hypothetical protein
LKIKFQIVSKILLFSVENSEIEKKYIMTHSHALVPLRPDVVYYRPDGHRKRSVQLWEGDLLDVNLDGRRHSEYFLDEVGAGPQADPQEHVNTIFCKQIHYNLHRTT